MGIQKFFQIFFRSIVIVLFALILPTVSALAETVVIKDCKVSFETSGEPVLIRILGKSDAICEGKVTIDGSKISDSSFKLDLSKIDTGIQLRNKHLRQNYLHVDKFPSATFRITKIDDLDKQRAGTKKDPSPVEGELVLHGEKAAVSNGAYQFKGNRVTVTFDIDLPTWKVDRPSFMGVHIVDKVHLTIKFDI